MVDILTEKLDPKERLDDYIDAVLALLEEAREELGKGDVRQAAEKLWGAAALAVKAYALWRDGERLTSRRELWGYKRRLEEELGERVSDAWAHANAMYTCFYEGWCAERDVDTAYRRVEKLVAAVRDRVRASGER